MGIVKNFSVHAIQVNRIGLQNTHARARALRTNEHVFCKNARVRLNRAIIIVAVSDDGVDYVREEKRERRRSSV